MALPSAPLVVSRSIPAAPLDQGEVARAALPFGSSFMLPKASYFDEAVLAWEREHVFGGWQCVGRTEELSEPGTSKAYDLGGFSVVITRDTAGELRGFENACRHRGHELLPCGASAQGRALVCPYHAWAYRHDGELIGAPNFREGPNFDQSRLGLNPVRIEDWHGWLWVDKSGVAPDFADHIGDLAQVVSAYDAADLVTAETHTYDVAANWKVIIENYQECYHCPSIHPELCAVSPPNSGDNIELAGNWIGGSMDLKEHAQTMSLDGSSGGVTMARLDEVQQRTVMYVAVMPNILISLHPDYVMTHLLTPLTPTTTRISCSWAFPKEATTREGFSPAYAVDFWDITNRQDWAACESVMRGMAAPSYSPGPLAPGEDGVYHFTSLMARMYAGVFVG